MKKNLCQQYEDVFMEKINSAKTHPNFGCILAYAEQCLFYHTGDGYYAIKARHFMHEICKMSEKEIWDYLDSIEC